MNRTGTVGEDAIVQAMADIGHNVTASDLSLYMIGNDAWSRAIGGRLKSMAIAGLVEKMGTVRGAGSGAYWRLKESTA